MTYTDTERAGSRVEAIYRELSALIEHPGLDPAAVEDGRAAAGGEASGYGGPGDGRAAAGGEANGYGSPGERERATTRFEEFSAAALAGKLAATLEHARGRSSRPATAGR